MPASAGMSPAMAETMAAFPVPCLVGLLVLGPRDRTGDNSWITCRFRTVPWPSLRRRCRRPGSPGWPAFDRQAVVGSCRYPVPDQRDRRMAGAGTVDRKPGGHSGNKACRWGVRRIRSVPDSRGRLKRHVRNSGIRLVVRSAASCPRLVPSIVPEASWLHASR